MNRILLVVIFISLFLTGCGSSSTSPPPTKPTPPPPTAATTPEKNAPAVKPASKPPVKKPTEGVRTAKASDGTHKPSSDGPDALGSNFMNVEALREKLKVGRIEPVVQFTADPAKLAANGIRQLEGKHLTLYTDLPSSPEIDELPKLFDAAYPQWCEYFRVDPVKNDDWKVKGVLMSNKETFRKAGLFPDTLPPFLHGFYQGDTFWLLDQPSDYYRRHLVIHEGTHAFMSILLGGAGPPWYMEGMAEYFGTHRWENGQLETRIMPQTNEEVPLWGRIEVIQDEVKGGKLLSLNSVMGTMEKEFLQNRPYGLTWGACALLDNHSLSQEKFRNMVTQVKLTGGFSERLMSELGDVLPQLEEAWELFALNAVYGYDWKRNEVVYRDPMPLSGESATIEIDSARGWQSTGILLEPGVKYEARATGKYVIRDDGTPWMCEPNGVTIHYWQGKPLGMLVGVLRHEPWMGGEITPLAKTNPVGPGTSLFPEGSSILFLKVNESPAELKDNQGKIQVQIKRTSN
ncbi:hypothetical protein GC197_16970 [bacterium]|nr:hypothetical protein [bacterium]